MGKTTGFMLYSREDPLKQLVENRIHHFNEFEELLPPDRMKKQAARCMDCGIPYCHNFGCPIKNRIPEWNDMVYRNQWKIALQLLHATNNFPEFTGRLCSAPCEAACTLSINQESVIIKHIELQIVEHGWKEGWIVPEPVPRKTNKRIAVIGSGPAGLTVAQQLIRSGHEVVVFERSDRIGGLLRYGIPDFKLNKQLINRRLDQMREEGVQFEVGVDVGVDVSTRYLQRSFQAVVIATGSAVYRNIDAPGRQFKGIHFAMDFLIQQNKRNAGDFLPQNEEVTAKDKQVVVIGGGDTGSDCVGVCRRQGAKSITQIELLPEPPQNRTCYNPWPTWPNILRTSSSQEEGCQRLWSILTKEFVGDKDHVVKLRCVRLEWSETEKKSQLQFKEISGSEFELSADLVLLAMGFVHVEHGSLIHDMQIQCDDRGNIVVDQNGMTSILGVFASGDCVRGASLIVHAICQGRQVAEGLNRYLKRSD